MARDLYAGGCQSPFAVRRVEVPCHGHAVAWRHADAEIHTNAVGPVVLLDVEETRPGCRHNPVRVGNALRVLHFSRSATLRRCGRRRKTEHQHCGQKKQSGFSPPHNMHSHGRKPSRGVEQIRAVLSETSGSSCAQSSHAGGLTFRKNSPHTSLSWPLCHSHTTTKRPCAIASPCALALTGTQKPPVASPGGLPATGACH